MKVGDVVYLKSLHGRGTTELKETTIKKVGKKYFEVECLGRYRFFIDNLYHDGGQYTSAYRIYLSIKDYEDEQRFINLYREIKDKYFSSLNGYNRLTLQQLEEISKILNK